MATICHDHFEALRTAEPFGFTCTHKKVDGQVYTFNGIRVCMECKPLIQATYEAFVDARNAEYEACPKCQAATEAKRKATQEEYDNRKCYNCGASPSEDRDVSMHSGVYECGKCWTWRKLDGPAARHWNKVAAAVAYNVDTYDVMTFMPKRVGMTQSEFNSMILHAQQIVEETDKMLKEHGEA